MSASIVFLLGFGIGLASGFVWGWILVLHLTAKSGRKRSQGTGHGEHPF